jgi:hypothetical protein
MKKLKSPPDYSLQKVQNSTKKKKNNYEFKILYAVKLEVDLTNPSCVKGDCCKDCGGHHYGG